MTIIQPKYSAKRYSYQNIFSASLVALMLYLLGHNSAFASAKSTIDITHSKSTETTLKRAFYLVVFEISPEWKKTHDDAVFSSVMQSPEYSSIFQKHFAYMGKLSATDIIFMGGPILNSLAIKQPLLDGAMFIYQAKTQHEAEVFINNDPLVINNIMRVKSISPFIRGV